jgi:predicted phosphodiesterase
MNRLLGIAACAVLSIIFAASSAQAGQASPWLVISDVHYTPFDHARAPSSYGEDTNDALLTSFLAEARKADPNPPVVIIAGDFLAHGFRLDAAGATMAALAKRFDAAFPRAQFVIALGNNDSSCGDYAAPIDGPFLAAAAKAWAPLVDRRGAAPDFAERFAHAGDYVARLPLPGLRVAVTNDVFDSLRYSAACAAGQNGAARTLARFQTDLRGARPGERNWVLFHIPPGIDTFTTTHLTHRLGVVPFLKPNARQDLDAIVTGAPDHVVLALAGHTHKFGYRILGEPGSPRVPMLLAPSVSPIFDNAPSFLEVTVASDGTLASVAETSLVDGRWQRVGDLGTLGMRRFTVSELEGLQHRLKRGAALRATFSRLYSGGGPPEIDERNWRSYWCAAANFTATAFEACTGQSGWSVVTGRGLWLGIAGLAALIAAAALFFFLPRPRPTKA